MSELVPYFVLSAEDDDLHDALDDLCAYVREVLLDGHRPAGGIAIVDRGVNDDGKARYCVMQAMYRRFNPRLAAGVSRVEYRSDVYDLGREMESGHDRMAVARRALAAVLGRVLTSSDAAVPHLIEVRVEGLRQDTQVVVTFVGELQL